MRNHSRSVSGLLTILIILILTGTLVTSLTAQDDPIITLYVPQFIQSNLEDDVFDEYTAQTGAQVVLVTEREDVNFGGTPNPDDPDTYFENADTYFSQADVVWLQSFNTNPYITRAGYLLDMAPLLRSDPAFDTADFRPGLLEAFAWDGATYGLPVSAFSNFWVYDPAAFDAAGVPYPSDAWTVNDFEAAVRALAQVDPATGDIEVPGYFGFNNDTLHRALIGQPAYDETTIPYTPDLTDPAIQQVLEVLSPLQAEGYIGGFNPEATYEPEDVPLRFGGRFDLVSAATSGTGELEAALLPGGLGSAQINGLGISAGTQYPQQAYELVKYLSRNEQFVVSLFGDVRVRYSLDDVESDDAFIFDRVDLSAETEAVLEALPDNLLTPSDLLFTNRLGNAVQRANSDEVTVGLAAVLEEVEAETIELLQLAEERAVNTQLAVATPVPTPVLQAGEVVLDFGVSSFTSPLPNRDAWDELIAEFSANDPQVGNINLDIGFASITDRAEQTDCFYSPANFAGNAQTDLATLLPLDPFTSADPAFDPADFPGAVLEGTTRGGQLYGLPIVIQPAALRYDPAAFADAGLFEPYVGWTITEFEDAVRNLQTDPEGDAPFQLSGFSGSSNTYLLMLMAAYGAVPIDTTADPIAIDLTDEQTLAGVQAVLDLAKGNYIQYNGLAQGNQAFFGGGGADEETAPIQAVTLNGFSFGGPPPDDEAEDPTRLASYPVGSTYTPVSYDVGTAYISAATEHPDACYRWLSAISQRPELFDAMPARVSLLDSPTYQAATAENEVAFYREFAGLLSAPSALEIGTIFGGADLDGFIYPIFVNQAFDDYVLEDVPLAEATDSAAQKVEAYRACVEPLPEPDLTADLEPEESIALIRPFAECAVGVDESLRQQFGFILGNDE